MNDTNQDVLPAGTAPPKGPLRQLAVAAAWIGLAVPLVGLALVGREPAALLLALAGYTALSGLALVLMRRGYPHDDLGLCNVVTLLRLALSAALLAPVLAPAPGWGVVAIALATLALDGIDGWLARRDGRVSAFGARLDVEVDAALSLILALNAWTSGTLGVFVLLLGLPRYVFMAASVVLPWMTAPLPERFDRKCVCVVQVAVLIALQAPIVEGQLAFALAAGTVLALAWSFGRDILWLRQARG